MIFKIVVFKTREIILVLKPAASQNKEPVASPAVILAQFLNPGPPTLSQKIFLF